MGYASLIRFIHNEDNMMTTTEYRALANKGAQLKAEGYGWADVLNTLDNIERRWAEYETLKNRNILANSAPSLANLCDTK